MQLEMGITSRRQLCEQWGRDYDEIQRQLRNEKNDAALPADAPQEGAP